MAVLKRVLIIDDDEINNFICIKNIKNTGFAEYASYCLRGKEALEELSHALAGSPEDLPDVIFLDINMPLMNAWDFLDEYKKMLPSFPKPVRLFILSSSVYRKDQQKAHYYEMISEYLIKPLSKEKLQELKAQYFS
jgi:CheY-like chemotaxis protein